MRGSGEHRPLSVDEVFDTLRSPIKTVCQVSHLIVALRFDAGRQVSSAKRLHPLLQPFEPAGYATSYRIGTKRNGEGEESQCHEQAEGAAVLPAHDHPPPIREFQSVHGPLASRMHPAAVHPSRRWGG